MADRDLELVRGFYAALTAGEREQIAARVLDPEIVWTPAREDPEPATRRGPAGVMAFFAMWEELFDGIELDVNDAREHGSCLLVELHVTGRGRGSGADVDQRVFQCISVRDGRIARVNEFYDRDEALEFAGSDPY